MNTALYMLRAKQLGLSLTELDEGMVIDMMIEAGNDLCETDYSQLATQQDFDRF